MRKEKGMQLQKDWVTPNGKKIKAGTFIDVTRDLAKKLIDKGILNGDALPDYAPEKNIEQQETKELKKKKVITK